MNKNGRILPMNDTVSKNTTMSIVATALLGFSGILSETSMNVTFPTLQKVYHLPLSSLQWITTVYLLAVAISMTVSATLQQNVKEKNHINCLSHSIHIGYNLSICNL